MSREETPTKEDIKSIADALQREADAKDTRRRIGAILLSIWAALVLIGAAKALGWFGS